MKRLLLYIVALGIAAVFLIPLLWTVSTALKTRQQVYSTPTQWIPTSYLAADGDGVLQPVTIVTRLNSPAAEVQLLSGPQSGQIIPVEQSALRELNGKTFVQLRAPDPVAIKLLHAFPTGIVEVRFAASNENVFLATSELHAKFAPQWRNFADAWQKLPLPFHWFLLNTYAITAVNVLGQTLSCSLVAYGFARFRFRGRTSLFLLLLSTMMLPPQVTMIPQYLLWKKLHALDSFTPLMAPAFFASSRVLRFSVAAVLSEPAKGIG